jgi:hypothetical protein
VRDEHDAPDRQPPLAPQIEKVRAPGFGREYVQSRERLVHQEDARMHDQRARESDALAHAAGKLAWIGRLETIEADQVDGRERPLADFVLGKTERFKPDLHVLQHG